MVECAAGLVESSYEELCRKAEQKAEAVDILAQQVLNLERWLTNHLAENIDRPPLKAP